MDPGICSAAAGAKNPLFGDYFQYPYEFTLDGIVRRRLVLPPAVIGAVKMKNDFIVINQFTGYCLLMIKISVDAPDYFFRCGQGDYTFNIPGVQSEHGSVVNPGISDFT